MENLQLIIYVIFGIIYLIFSVLKKRNKEQETGTPPLFEEEEMSTGDPYHQKPANRPSEPASLEELLERYDHAKQRAKQRASDKLETMQEQVDDEFIPVSSNEPTIRNMEAEALEQMQRTERLKALQEELPPQARTKVIEKERQLVRTSSPKKKVGGKSKVTESSRRFKAYDKQQPVPISHHVKSLLSSKRGLQQAFILTEVLNRKHF